MLFLLDLNFGLKIASDMGPQEIMSTGNEQ